MVHARPSLPAGHGEVLCRPAFADWRQLAEGNRQLAASWSFDVAGIPVAALRSSAREDALEQAGLFSAKLGVNVARGASPDGLIAMTGHQPELYHPGVWVKDFLLQRFADETGAAAVDIVVDTDGFETVALSAPCMKPGVERCHLYLAVGAQDSCFAGAPVPSRADLDSFCSAADSMLSSLPAPAIRRHFASFCGALGEASDVAENLGELITIARRRYEAPAGTDYLELPLTRLARTHAWLAFVVDMALSAERFSAAYNAELADYRAASKTRSAAQPFPDLAREGDSIELPLWRIANGHRTGVRAVVRRDGSTALVDAAGSCVVELPADAEAAIAVLRDSGELLAPKALALTLFSRMFVADLFIHGVGGGRYDRVTDGVCRRYYGVEPPAFVVASMTMYLPIGVHVVSAEEVAAARERLNRIDHNPDALLGEVEFDSGEERARALSLAAEKTALVDAIAAPGADKKALGMRIRELNAALSAMLEPLRADLAGHLASLESQLAASEILTDRTYPFCFWSPQEVADKAR